MRTEDVGKTSFPGWVGVLWVESGSSSPPRRTGVPTSVSLWGGGRKVRVLETDLKEGDEE